MATLRRFLLILSWLATPTKATPLVFNTYIDPPYVEQTKGQIIGLSIDVFRLLKQHSQLDLQLHILPLKRAYKVAQTSPNQCVFAIERTQSREPLFTWIGPMFVSRYAIFQRNHKQRLFNSLFSLEGLTIGSYLGSGIGEYLTSFGINIELAKNNLNSAQKLSRHRTDGWAADVLSAAYIQQNYMLDIEHQGFPFYSSLRSIACNRNSEQDKLFKLQQSLNQLQKNGQIKQIIKGYEEQYQVNLGL